MPLNNGTCGIIWPQSAHDPDAAWNAAMALCVDHLQRRGKRKDWVRYELHWNYLYSNKNCAMVQSAWMGMIWPLFLCFSLVGFLFFAYSLLTIAPPFGDQFAYQTVSSLLIIQAWYNLRHYGAKTKLLTINLGIQIKWIFDWCFCLAPAAFAICGIVLLVAWGIAIYNFVRSLLCFTKYAGLVAFKVITSTAINTVCFLWTPITTTISVVCPYAIVFVMPKFAFGKINFLGSRGIGTLGFPATNHFRLTAELPSLPLLLPCAPTPPMPSLMDPRAATSAMFVPQPPVLAVTPPPSLLRRLRRLVRHLTRLPPPVQEGPRHPPSRSPPTFPAPRRALRNRFLCLTLSLGSLCAALHALGSLVTLLARS